ncbi:MAG: DUF3987 domain-containing protein, partial [Methylocystaceae bacterium]|nr:DUF3987 domain-containing protein [Methylocystaceae bacterium]
ALAVQAVAAAFGLEPYLDVGKTLANSIFFNPRVASENLHLAESFSTDGQLLNFEPYLDAADQHVAREVAEAEKEAALKAQSIFKNISDDNASITDGDLMARLRHSIGTMEDVLRKYGYKEYPEAKRWAPPNSDTLAPGILLSKGKDGVTRLYSHHANDPLCGEKKVFGSRAHDVIDVVIAHEYGTSDQCRALGIYELMKKYGITSAKSRKSDVTKAQKASEIKPQKWSEVINFIEPQYIPQFPMDALNPSERDYVQKTARSIGVENGPIAITMLANASAALDARTKLKPKQFASWEESKCFWLCLLGPPAAKKSPILNRVKKPIQKIQDLENSRYKTAKAKFDLLPKDQKAKEVEPNCKHYMVQDTTIEALARALSHQDRGTTLLVDELETVFQSMSRYKKTGSDRSHYLVAHQGGSVNIMRVGGGYTIVDNFAFGLIGGIQPDVIAKYKHTEDGLLERFIYVRLSEAIIGEDIDTSEVDAEFERKIRIIAEMKPEVFTFDAAAKECINRIEKTALSLSAKCRIVGPGFGGWSGKLVSHYARIVIALHVLRGGGNCIGIKTAQDAEKILNEYVIPQATAFFRLENSSLFERERALAVYILAKGLTRFVASDITANVREFRMNRGDKKAHDIVTPIAETLVTYGWIQLEEPDKLRSAWIVNPAVHELFADQAKLEQERRETIHQLIRKTAQKNKRPEEIMSPLPRSAALAALVLLLCGADSSIEPTNDLPNPYRSVAPWGKLPAGQTWGAFNAVAIDNDGISLWVANRCGAFPDIPPGASAFQYDSCAGSNVAPVMKLDTEGNIVKTFGAGMFIFPHKIYPDRDGNIWVVDQRDINEREKKLHPYAGGKGHAVYKFSADGKLLMTIGRPGVPGNPPDGLY